MTPDGAGGVVTAGEIMALFTAPDIGPMRHAHSLRLGMAGAEGNVAIGVARLGVPARWIGRVGGDEFGALITNSLRGEGVQVISIVDESAPTGLMFKERRTESATRVRYYRQNSAGSRLCPSDIDGDAVRSAAVLHLSGITAALSASARDAVYAAIAIAAEHGVPVSFDLNYRQALWTPAEAGPVLRELASKADILFATEDEAELVINAGGPLAKAKALAALGPRQVVLKRGAQGAIALADDVEHQVPLHQVTAIDPVGAGDAFTAGYLAEVANGSDVDTSLATAARTGAFAVTVRGDWEGAPTRAELALLDADGADVHR